MRASVRHCGVSLEQNTCKNIARQHVVCGIAAKQTPLRHKFLRSCKWECSRPELCLQSCSLGNPSSHTRRRGQGRIVRVGRGCGCQLAVGSGRLFHSMLLVLCKQYTVRAHVFLIRTVSQRLLSEFVVVTGTHFTFCLAQAQDEALSVVQNSSHHLAPCLTLNH